MFAPLKTGSAEFKSAILLRFLFMLGLYPIQRFILFLLEDRYGVDNPLARASVFVILAIIVAAAGGLTAGLLDNFFSAKQLLYASVLVAAGALVGVAFSPTLYILVVPSLILAFTAGAFQALNWGAIANALPDEEAARYFGLANIATAGASALTGLFGPLVDFANRFVPGATYQILFTICALVTLSCVLVLRRAPVAEET
jgi:MFS family permease